MGSGISTYSMRAIASKPVIPVEPMLAIAPVTLSIVTRCASWAPLKAAFGADKIIDRSGGKWGGPFASLPSVFGLPRRSAWAGGSFRTARGRADDEYYTRLRKLNDLETGFQLARFS